MYFMEVSKISTRGNFEELWLTINYPSNQILGYAFVEEVPDFMQPAGHLAW